VLEKFQQIIITVYEGLHQIYLKRCKELWKQKRDKKLQCFEMKVSHNNNRMCIVFSWQSQLYARLLYGARMSIDQFIHVLPKNDTNVTWSLQSFINFEMNQIVRNRKFTIYFLSLSPVRKKILLQRTRQNKQSIHWLLKFLRI
jgi:hypothetical protein